MIVADPDRACTPTCGAFYGVLSVIKDLPGAVTGRTLVGWLDGSGGDEDHLLLGWLATPAHKTTGMAQFDGHEGMIAKFRAFVNKKSGKGRPSWVISFDHSTIGKRSQVGAHPRTKALVTTRFGIGVFQTEVVDHTIHIFNITGETKKGAG